MERTGREEWDAAMAQRRASSEDKNKTIFRCAFSVAGRLCMHCERPPAFTGLSRRIARPHSITGEAGSSR